MWMLVSFICAAWVFLGIAAMGFAAYSENILWIVVSVVVWFLNWGLLAYANKKWPNRRYYE